MALLRAGLALLLGVFTASLVAYIGAVLVLVVWSGIPLGASGVTTPAEYAAILVLAGVASATGGHAAARLAGRLRVATVVGVAANLVVVMLWGFTGQGVRWPPWWAPLLSATTAAGVLTALRRHRVRRLCKA